MKLKLIKHCYHISNDVLLKKIVLVSLTVLLIIAGTLVGCDGDDPPGIDDMINYVQKTWRIVASTDDIKQVLDLDDPMSHIPFKSEIGGILTVISMKQNIDKGEYHKAAEKGATWLLPFGLKEIGLQWLSSYVSLGTVCYEYFNWLYEKANQEAFNAQVQYYIWYREDGISESEMRRDYAVRNGYLQNPRYEGSIQPSSSEFTPEDVFRVGRAFWDAKDAEQQYRVTDEELIRGSFLNALMQIKTSAIPIQTSFTLTLYVHDGSASGPVISGAQVSGQDANGISFSQTTNSAGYVTITGAPGLWSFSVSKAGYQTNTWTQFTQVTETRHAYLIK